jgi:hypothetical protein
MYADVHGWGYLCILDPRYFGEGMIREISQVQREDLEILLLGLRQVSARSKNCLIEKGTNAEGVHKFSS